MTEAAGCAGKSRDRARRPPLYRNSFLLTGIALATISLAVLFALKAVEIWHIYALMFIRSLGSAFHWPAMQASTTLLVPEELLSRIAGLNQTLEGAANIAAPPMAALLIGLLPMEGVLSLDVITAGLAILPLLFIAIPQPATGEKASAGSLITAEIMEALRFVFAKPGFVFMFILAMLVNLVIVPAFSLLPLLVKVHFRGGALQLAGLESSMGFGMIAGGLALGVWGGFKSRMLTGISALILAGVSFGLLGVLPSTGLVLAMATIFVTGLMLPVANGSMHALMQAVIPPEMQGRVFTLVISGASP
ncbi:MAG: MFS transporter [Firmicutes bacterium]|nr:MFS transporter [Bacillota bacterium]